MPGGRASPSISVETEGGAARRPLGGCSPGSIHSGELPDLCGLDAPELDPAPLPLLPQGQKPGSKTLAGTQAGSWGPASRLLGSWGEPWLTKDQIFQMSNFPLCLQIICTVSVKSKRDLK